MNTLFSLLMSDNENNLDTVEQNTIPETTYETAEHPMSEALYNCLANVSGFCDVNGQTYQIYKEQWKIRVERYLNL